MLCSVHLLVGILTVRHVSFSCTCSLGRRPAFFIYLFIECFFGVATAFAQDFVTWSVFRFGVGFTVPAILGTPYVLGECCLFLSYSSALQQQRSGDIRGKLQMWWDGRFIHLSGTCLNAISLHPISNVPTPVFAKPWVFNSICPDLLQPNLKINVEIMDGNWPALFGRVGISLHRFSRNILVAQSFERRNLYRILSESDENGSKVRLISVYALKKSMIFIGRFSQNSRLLENS